MIIKPRQLISNRHREQLERRLQEAKHSRAGAPRELSDGVLLATRLSSKIHAAAIDGSGLMNALLLYRHRPLAKGVLATMGFYGFGTWVGPWCRPPGGAA